MNNMGWLQYHENDVEADVLIVDDSMLNRKIASNVCEQNGLTYDTLPDGHLALERLKGHTYSLVLIDNEMPTMNGEEVIKQIRLYGYTEPIVMMSGTDFGLQQKEYLAHIGTTAFLPKGGQPSIMECLAQLGTLKDEYNKSYANYESSMTPFDTIRGYTIPDDNNST